ncbi:MAG: 2OG-Fe(II) oxygenase, partial [Frankiales bacterium]|nr:2OG-Fe(II) oxygenase [Frankiales bacterium]
MAAATTHDGVLAVPTIDISAFRTPTDGSPDRSDLRQQAQADVAAAVDDAARTVGFMQIVGHGIAESVITDFTSATSEFFDLPPEVKARYRCPPGVNRGYSPPKSEYLASSLGLTSAADLFEAINIGTDAAAYPDLELPRGDYAPNSFPSEVAGFEAAVIGWFAEAGAIARVMTRIFAIALGLPENHFDRYTDHSLDVLRMNNYRLPAADVQLEPDQVGMGAHTDYGIVTVLLADQVPGLEILGADGRWHPVLPADGALLVNLGDALAR